MRPLEFLQHQARAEWSRVYASAAVLSGSAVHHREDNKPVPSQSRQQVTCPTRTASPSADAGASRQAHRRSLQATT